MYYPQEINSSWYYQHCVNPISSLPFQVKRQTKIKHVMNHKTGSGGIRDSLGSVKEEWKTKKSVELSGNKNNFNSV